jgi:hypothetical protein
MEWPVFLCNRIGSTRAKGFELGSRLKPSLYSNVHCRYGYARRALKSLTALTKTLAMRKKQAH